MDYNYSYSTSYSSSSATLDPGVLLFASVASLALSILMIASMWKLFTKAGKPGWAAIVPIYNIIVMLEIVGRPLWWIALFFIPFANVVIMIMLYIDLAKAYGKGGGFAALLILLPYIGFPVLAFGSSSYVGPVASDNNLPTSTPPQPPQAPQQPMTY